MTQNFHIKYTKVKNLHFKHSTYDIIDNKKNLSNFYSIVANSNNVRYNKLTKYTGNQVT